MIIRCNVWYMIMWQQCFGCTDIGFIEEHIASELLSVKLRGTCRNCVPAL